MSKKIPSKIPENIKEYISYNSVTGDLTWIKRPSNRAQVGTIAGNANSTNGYTVIEFKHVPYKAHRVAWFLKTGEQPPDEIDHRDGDGLNNAWGNLRDATHNQNQHNKGKQHGNSSGYKGVTYVKTADKWRARIMLNNKSIHLGYFDAPELAHEAYCKAADEYHKEFANHGTN